MQRILSFVRPTVFHFKISGPITTRTVEKLRAELKLLWGYKARALAVSVDSPGGYTSQAEIVAQLLGQIREKQKIPIFTFAQDLALGSAYQILSVGDVVYSDQSSLIGGMVGFLQTLGFQKLIADYKVKSEFLNEGDEKFKMNPFEKLKPQNEKWIQQNIKKYQEIMIENTLKNRSIKSVDQLKSGQVFLGYQALKHGLVDQIGETESEMEKMYPQCKIISINQRSHRGFRGLREIQDIQEGIPPSELLKDQYFSQLSVLLSNRLQYFN